MAGDSRGLPGGAIHIHGVAGPFSKQRTPLGAHTPHLIGRARWMKSTDVYRVLRTRLGPTCKTAGLRRTRSGMLGWHRPSRAGHLVLFFQCTQHGWGPLSPHLGSMFTLTFQRSPAPRPGAGVGVYFLRFNTLLTPDDLALMREYQRQVIADLQRQWSAFVEGQAAGYRDTLNADVWSQLPWMLYASETHVERWADFFVPRLPRLLAEFEARAAGQADSGA